ncbi:hypothetical protein L1987_87520 [Smallanthus sonchifolius]|nr:hypothetical protein L1987_87520 [Smallanthus sonchifolius]
MRDDVVTETAVVGKVGESGCGRRNGEHFPAMLVECDRNIETSYVTTQKNIHHSPLSSHPVAMSSMQSFVAAMVVVTGFGARRDRDKRMTRGVFRVTG